MLIKQLENPLGGKVEVKFQPGLPAEDQQMANQWIYLTDDGELHEGEICVIQGGRGLVPVLRTELGDIQIEQVVGHGAVGPYVWPTVELVARCRALVEEGNLDEAVWRYQETGATNQSARSILGLN